MTPKKLIEHGNEFPYDASDEWWDGPGNNPPPPNDKAHATARGVIADLQDRRGIKNGFADVDESVRVDIVNAIAEIIRKGME